MGTLQIRNRIPDDNGQSCSVVVLSPIGDTEQCYRIAFRGARSGIAARYLRARGGRKVSDNLRDLYGITTIIINFIFLAVCAII